MIKQIRRETTWHVDRKPKFSQDVTATRIETKLTPQDRRQLKDREISIQTLEQQLAMFRHGIPFARLKRPCRLNDGIHGFRSSDLPAVTQAFEQAKAAGRITKFVPTSGVGTRMFKGLEAFRLKRKSNRVTAAEQHELEQFLAGLPKFAFYQDLNNVLLHQGYQLDQLILKRNSLPIIDALLNAPGLNYAKLPKGLLAFHRYAAATRTPIEEHLVEALDYAKDDSGYTRIHFTVSLEHQHAIQQHIEQACHRLARHSVTWLINCSVQKPSTDTVAVTMDNHPFHDSQGILLFRPGGHGVLLQNLHQLHGDIVFIKNIDNVVPDHLKETASQYKKALGGLLVNLQDTLFSYLTQLESGTASSASLEQITEWAQHWLGMTLPQGWGTRTNSQKAQWLFKWLKRPLRVCGMVPHTKHPGGGPFWVEQEDGTISLQIVESSQIDPGSPTQQDIFMSSTHFNPVDIVCGVRDHRGNPFPLSHFVDHNSGFISKKSHEGSELKALELPGLWNGGMAKWHSVFVEVPSHTFNPVKTVLDLLSPAHQPPEHS